MAVFNLNKTNHKDGTYGLHPQSTYYTEDYAERMCNFYLTDELYKNDRGNIDTYYRLHAKKPHSSDDALAYDVYCPKCGRQMRQITTNYNLHTLGYYECKKCNDRGGHR